MDSAIRRVPSGFPGWVAYFHVYGACGEDIIAKEDRPGGHQARPTDLLRPAQMPYRFPRAGASSSCSKTWAQPWAQNPPEYRAIPWSIMQGSGRRTNYIAFLEQSAGCRFESCPAHQIINVYGGCRELGISGTACRLGVSALCQKFMPGRHNVTHHNPL